MKILLPFSSVELEQQIAAIDRGIQVEVVDLHDLPAEIDADAMLAIGISEAAVLQNLLDAAANLRWIHVLGTGVDNFPLEMMGQRRLTCSRGAHALPIAEWVMAMVLAADKSLPASWVSEPPESWHTAELRQVSGRQLSLFGFGCIGALVAERARAFGMPVKALVRQPRQQWPDGVTPAEDFADLVRDADHLVLAAPATPATRHIINARSLDACKPGVHLVNIGRGALVDQQALAAALDSGQVARASLDVVEPEPLPAGHWLYEHPSVYLSPHISWSSEDTLNKLLQPFLANIDHFTAGRPLEGEVDLEAGY